MGRGGNMNMFGGMDAMRGDNMGSNGMPGRLNAMRDDYMGTQSGRMNFMRGGSMNMSGGMDAIRDGYLGMPQGTDSMRGNNMVGMTGAMGSLREDNMLGMFGDFREDNISRRGIERNMEATNSVGARMGGLEPNFDRNFRSGQMSDRVQRERSMEMCGGMPEEMGMIERGSRFPRGQGDDWRNQEGRTAMSSGMGNIGMQRMMGGGRRF